MARRRKAKQKRKNRRQTEELKPKPLWKKLKLWVAGMVLAGAVGALAVNQMKETASPRKTFSSKTPMSEERRGTKRRLYINFVSHKTEREVTCSLTKALNSIKPAYVFLENAYALHKENDVFEAHFNDKTKSETELFSLYSQLGRYFRYRLLHRYIRKSPEDVKFFHAESYSRAEIKFFDKYLRWLNAKSKGFRLLNEGQEEVAVESWGKEMRLLAKQIRIRNDRIVETVGRKWANPKAIGLITVGAAHLNLATMFEKIGYEVKFTNLMEGGRLVAHFEALERGWKTAADFNEFSETAKNLLCVAVSVKYDKIGFGGGGSALEMCRRIVKHMDLKGLKAIRRSRSWPDIIESLHEQGYEFPRTKQDFERKMVEFRICH